MQNDTVKITKAAMPGGGFLRYFEMQIDVFGVLANKQITDLRADTKKERRAAARAIERIMRTHNMLTKYDRILSVSVGVDLLGNACLIVVVWQGSEEQL